MALVDLDLTLKHVHWNVVGPTFIGVHQMLDPQVDAVRGMVDTTAERIATLGASPNGLPGNLVEPRTWDDYPIGRATSMQHLGALDPSTTASSATTARRSTRPKSSTRSPRTC